MPGHQCFVGKVYRNGDEAFIKEAGEHSCVRGEDPLIFGMKIAKQASCPRILPPYITPPHFRPEPKLPPPSYTAILPPPPPAPLPPKVPSFKFIPPIIARPPPVSRDPVEPYLYPEPPPNTSHFKPITSHLPREVKITSSALSLAMSSALVVLFSLGSFYLGTGTPRGL